MGLHATINVTSHGPYSGLIASGPGLVLGHSTSGVIVPYLTPSPRKLLVAKLG